MQYVWQHRLFSPIGLRTVDGRRISIINPGLLNNGPGPDFFNASIEIDGQKWVGNVELHVRASDWLRHGHQNDDAYDSVILHVVDVDDTIIRRANGAIIPQMRLPCSPDLHIHYRQLTANAPSDLTCATAIMATPRIYLTDWISSLAYERLHQKSERIMDQLEQYAGDWESTAYVTLARALGMGINAEPFERLARSLPLRFIRKHTDNPIAVEALFFGQAGMIPQGATDDEYVEALRTEYAFLANKFSLSAPTMLGWKNSGIRPGNCPQRRIAYLAMLATEGKPLMAAINDIRSLDDARTLFARSLQGYWATHYNFSPNSSPSLTRPVNPDVLIINAAVPLIYSYGSYVGDTSKTDLAIRLLEELPPEHNRLVDIFAAAGIKPANSLESQALIQLRRSYCEQRKCIYCRFGHQLLSSAAIRQQ